MNFFVCQAGAGNLNNNGRKGNKYHSAKAKNDRIRRVIMNNSFDLIESDPGNVYKYMEYMTMLDAAHEPYICQINFSYRDVYLKQFTDSMDSME